MNSLWVGLMCTIAPPFNESLHAFNEHFYRNIESNTSFWKRNIFHKHCFPHTYIFPPKTVILCIVMLTDKWINWVKVKIQMCHTTSNGHLFVWIVVFVSAAWTAHSSHFMIRLLLLTSYSIQFQFVSFIWLCVSCFRHLMYGDPVR